MIRRCDVCGDTSDDGCIYNYAYTWGETTVPGLSNVVRTRWLEPKRHGSAYICSSCSTSRIVRVRWRKEIANTLVATCIFLLPLPALYWAGMRLLFQSDYTFGDTSSLTLYFLTALAIGVIGGLMSASADYSDERIPYLLGRYAWQIHRPKLIANGLPSQKEGLQLSGDGVREALSGPQDLARVRRSRRFARQDRFVGIRLSVVALPWYLLLYGGCVTLAMVLWMDDDLRHADPLGHMYGLWLAVTATVVLNPIVAGVSPWFFTKVLPLVRRPPRKFVYSLIILAALPPAGMGMWRAISEPISGLLMIGGAVVIALLVRGVMQLWFVFTNATGDGGEN